jgi:hypothetical protein
VWCCCVLKSCRGRSLRSLEEGLLRRGNGELGAGLGGQLAEQFCGGSAVAHDQQEIGRLSTTSSPVPSDVPHMLTYHWLVGAKCAQNRATSVRSVQNQMH